MGENLNFFRVKSNKALWSYESFRCVKGKRKNKADKKVIVFLNLLPEMFLFVQTTPYLSTYIACPSK